MEDAVLLEAAIGRTAWSLSSFGPRECSASDGDATATLAAIATMQYVKLLPLPPVEQFGGAAGSFDFRLTCRWVQLPRSCGVIQCTPKPSNDDAPRTVVCGSLDAIVDVEDEFRHVVMPVEPDYRLRR